MPSPIWPPLPWPRRRILPPRRHGHHRAGWASLARSSAGCWLRRVALVLRISTFSASSLWTGRKRSPPWPNASQTLPPG
ncbi:MAG: hypothetical protein B7Z10_00420 [Rhodobacterales bacterium 32-66-7]|nr:MAG: hypothetical protein B7Z10_00420 [Rhodobacterales bacterium 32-66-7]